MWPGQERWKYNLPKSAPKDISSSWKPFLKGCTVSQWGATSCGPNDPVHETLRFVVVNFEINYTQNQLKSSFWAFLGGKFLIGLFEAGSPPFKSGLHLLVAVLQKEREGSNFAFGPPAGICSGWSMLLLWLESNSTLLRFQRRLKTINSLTDLQVWPAQIRVL